MLARLISWFENMSRSSPVTSSLMLPFPLWIIAIRSVIGLLKLPVVKIFPFRQYYKRKATTPIRIVAQIYNEKYRKSMDFNALNS